MKEMGIPVNLKELVVLLHGVPPPEFEEQQGFLIVTFKARLVPEVGSEGGQKGAQPTQSAT